MPGPTIHQPLALLPQAVLSKSTDGGASWFNPNTNSQFFVSQLIVDPTNSATLYAISANGMVKSPNGGASWGDPLLPGSRFNNLIINPQTPSTLYASNFNEIYQTTGGGTNWHSLQQGFPTCQ